MKIEKKQKKNMKETNASSSSRQWFVAEEEEEEEGSAREIGPRGHQHYTKMALRKKKIKGCVRKKKNQRGCVRRKKKKLQRRERVAGERVTHFFLKITQGYYGLFTSSAGCTNKNAGCT